MLFLAFEVLFPPLGELAVGIFAVTELPLCPVRFPCVSTSTPRARLGGS
jgi:hypothetical protein